MKSSSISDDIDRYRRLVPRKYGHGKKIDLAQGGQCGGCPMDTIKIADEIDRHRRGFLGAAALGAATTAGTLSLLP
jgi:hypothetical protein